MDSDIPIVIVTTDWRLDQVATRVYGQCLITVSHPFDHLGYKRGFTLITPNSSRCAAMSLILGMELVESYLLDKKNVHSIIVSTKYKWLYDILTNGSLKRWIDLNKWPKDISPSKRLYQRAYEILKDITMDARVSFVYIERDEDDKPFVDLAPEDEMKDGCVDVEAIAKRGGGKEAVEAAMQQMRMRNVLIDELFASGARSSRPQKKQTKLKKK